MTAINKRYDFVLLFDVMDGNPNGDPDADNLPRLDPENSHGLVTDVCLKRKIRNYVTLAKAVHPPYDIFVQDKAVLNELIAKPYHVSDKVKLAMKEWEEWKKSKKKEGRPKHPEDVAKEWMCENFFDIRTFGAVMSTSDKEDGEEAKSKIKLTAGQVRGAVQLTFARSADPIISLENTITRMAVTKEADREKERTMGRKSTVPYGLYRAHGFISAHLAAQTGFSNEDLELLWEALGNMFEHDRSAARGFMSTRGLYVFEHENALGNAPAQSLFEHINVQSNTSTPRQFEDYTVSVINEEALPKTVKLHRKYESKPLVAKAA